MTLSVNISRVSVLFIQLQWFSHIWRTAHKCVPSMVFSHHCLSLLCIFHRRLRRFFFCFFVVVLLFFLLHSYIISGTSLSCAFFVNIFELRTLIYLNLMLHMNFFKKLLFQCDFSIVVCEAPLII